MQFSESWLRSFVNPALSSNDLAHLLTMAGLEVERVSPVAPEFNRVVIAEVLSKERHPDADRLNVLTVNIGDSEPLVVVCGAPNVTVGMKAPCALVGATLPGGDTERTIEIKQARVRGVTSYGMMCSARELGLAQDGGGLLQLAADAPIGQNIRSYLDLDDHIFTLKLTPNRSDCLSLYGIAREVCALTRASLASIPRASFVQDHDRRYHVKVKESGACPRYTGRIITGVNAKVTTPTWMVRRLERCGLRSINPLVDVTNYVLLEYGQPLHAFDLDKLSGGLEVRFARPGERLRLLNEQDVTLQSDMLVIADGRGPVALAGVMGGADSAVGDQTADIFLESAFFSPAVVAGKSRRLGFSSDSAYRFERGVDFAGTQFALDRATQLIIDICGGKAGAMCEVTGELPVRHAVTLRPCRARRVLGMDMSVDDIATTLSRLGMQYRRLDEEFLVTPPSYRFDIMIEEDLIEEVARVYGYERIPPLLPEAPMGIVPLPEALVTLASLRQALVLRDYHETVNYSFIEPEWERDLCGNVDPIPLKNPIASQLSVMRSSLLPGLIGALRTNLAHRQPRVRLFEVGGCFAVGAGGYMQHERIGGLAYGTAAPEQWGVAARHVDFYDVKGDVEALFFPRRVICEAMPHPGSHPGRSACILLNGRPVGWIGELHPRWQQRYDIPQPVIWFEVDLAALQNGEVPRAAALSYFPRVRRDLAVIVDEKVPVQALLQAMLLEKAPHVLDIALFDLYRGIGVEQGKKSLAFRVLLQDTQKTLVDNEIDQSMARLLGVLEKQGARLRT